MLFICLFFTVKKRGKACVYDPLHGSSKEPIQHYYVFVCLSKTTVKTKRHTSYLGSCCGVYSAVFYSSNDSKKNGALQEPILSGMGHMGRARYIRSSSFDESRCLCGQILCLVE